jgi:cytochrome c6
MRNMIQVILRKASSTMTSQQVARMAVVGLLLACIARSVMAADFFMGREIYEMHCESCHGAEGRSMEPGVPDFSSGDAMFQTDADLYSKIRDGTDTMPAYRGILTEAEVRNVIAYLRSLQK